MGKMSILRSLLEGMSKVFSLQIPSSAPYSMISFHHPQPGSDQHRPRMNIHGKINSAPTWGIVDRSQKLWSQLHKLIYVDFEEAADLLYFGNKQLKILATVTWFAAKAQKVCCELTAVRVKVNSKTTVQIKILSSENVCLVFFS